jgi:hypothetical protein
VYKEDVFLAPAAALRTGVPAFLGFTRQVPRDERENPQFYVPQALTLWPQLEAHFGPPLPDGYLAYAVRGFFENGGSLCYVVPMNLDTSIPSAVQKGLAALATLDAVDLVCAPDVIRLRPPQDIPPLDDFDPLWANYVDRLLKESGLSPNPEEVLAAQAALLDHCDRLGDRFAILDSLPGANPTEVIQQRARLRRTNGALYYPWIEVPSLQEAGKFVRVPPCGHLAGVYARSDERLGVHKAPGNELVESVVNLEINLSNAQQGPLNSESVNCLRAFPGRGIRVWGVRTLSDDPAWLYINTRRLFLTVGRWVERNLAGVVYEPNDPRLWARIKRELTAYINRLFQQGALKGRTEQEAFYVKCDAETNPPEVRDAGQVAAEIGLAPAVPNEFVVVRIIHGAAGTTISAAM